MRIPIVVRAAFACALAGMPTVAIATTGFAQQTGTIGGEVIDSRSLRPVAGAQVAVVGTDLGTLTDENGRFLIEDVPGLRHTLRAVMIGYQTLSEPVEVGDTAVRLALVESAIELNEIVVTGTPGAVQKRAIGNTVSSIDASDVQAISPAPAVSNLIAGRAAGVVVIPGTGMVGSGPRIRIRGASSFSLSNQPLLYIDGIRVNNDVSTGPNAQGTSAVISRLNDLNPGDIASIEIIKGPAAATLYGTEASNGVIQIITKKGNAEGSELGVSLRLATSCLMNPEDKIPVSYARDPDTGELLTFDPVREEAARGTPLFQNGITQEYGVHARGGSGPVR